jgi:hypothetical protein
VHRARFGFSATVLTLLFTVYVVAAVVTLLFLGSVSDYVGRLPARYPSDRRFRKGGPGNQSS